MPGPSRDCPDSGAAEQAPVRLGAIQEPQRTVRAGTRSHQCCLLFGDEGRDRTSDQRDQCVRLLETRSRGHLQSLACRNHFAMTRFAREHLVQRGQFAAVIPVRRCAPAHQPGARPFPEFARLRGGIIERFLAKPARQARANGLIEQAGCDEPVQESAAAANRLEGCRSSGPNSVFRKSNAGWPPRNKGSAGDSVRWESSWRECNP